MKMLKIIDCSDTLMWYRDKIGQNVPYVMDISEGYLSREDAGYTNIVLRQDAEIIEIEPCK